MKKALGLAAAAVFMAAAPASAEVIDRVTAAQLETALETAGLSPEMLSSADGAPVARGTAGEFTFFVRAVDCSGRPVACENLIFFANFDLGRAATARDFRIANAFKDGQVFGRAYVLESNNQVGVDYVIELGGGVTEDHLAKNINRWADVINAFVAKFQEGYSGS